jgi:hypothetical protein
MLGKNGEIAEQLERFAIKENADHAGYVCLHGDDIVLTQQVDFITLF